MSTHTPDRDSNDPYEDIQPTDDAEIEAALESIADEGIERQADDQRTEHQATVRKLIATARNALTGRSPLPIEDLLLAIHWHLREHPDLSEILSPSADDLEIVDDETKLAFQKQMDIRDRSETPPDPSTEFETQIRLAIELNYVSALHDTTNYAPVYLEKLDPDEVPHAPDIDEVTPIGRRRLKTEDAADPEEREVVIPHDDCDHILAIAKPREGKDSTLTSIGMNLWREHGYKYVSLHDDGRMETPMLTIPNDEEVIQENLKWFNQRPRAMDTEVFVPRMEGTPDVLPANFETFTLGIDALSPKDILRLAGVTESDPSMEVRIKEALKITLDRSGQVDELINLLFDFADGLEATIEWTEVRDRHQDGSVETYETSMELPAEKAVRKAAQRLARLAGEGFIASPDAATNLDFHDLLKRNEKAAILCCNFIDASDGFKYTIMDLWLQKIMDARDEWPRLPRVCLECRELKNVAPSRIRYARYRDQIRALQQTFRVITSQGGSRRVLLLGSTQKFNDVLKPVRNNMDTKILLRQSQEQIGELDKNFGFTTKQFQQLQTFQTGQGMIYADGEPFWPIEWRGSPCGLGLGDKVWRDRYGKAWGARVRETGDVPWSDSDAPLWWVDVLTGDAVVGDERKPAVGGWYLLPEDFPGPISGIEDVATISESLSDRLIQWVLKQRREYPVPSDLSLEPVDGGDRQRNITLKQVGQETTHEDIAKRHDIPHSIKAWLRKAPATRQQYIQVCELVAENQFESYNQLYKASNVDWAEGTLRNHASKDDGLGPCLERGEGGWSLTPVGQKVLEIDWGAVETGLQEVDR